MVELCKKTGYYDEIYNKYKICTIKNIIIKKKKKKRKNSK